MAAAFVVVRVLLVRVTTLTRRVGFARAGAAAAGGDAEAVAAAAVAAVGLDVLDASDGTGGRAVPVVAALGW